MLMKLTKFFDPRLFLLFGVGLITFWFRVYFTAENIPSVDLPSHILLARQMRDHLLSGRIVFYDFGTFTGFPVNLFYGFIPSLLAVLISYPLGLFVADPIVLGMHISLVAGMALLPLSIYFAAKPLVQEFVPSINSAKNVRAILAILAVTLGFWFVNHDKQWHGIGAAAPMNIGLHAQVFGWHLFILYLGFIARLYLVGDDRKANSRLFLGLALTYGLLPVTHTLTFVFATFTGGLLFLFLANIRKRMFAAHLLGFCLAGFWFIPSLSLLGTYTTYDVIRPEGDFFEIIFRYPWYGLLRTFKSWLSGEKILLDLVHIILPFIIVAGLIHPKIKRDGFIFNLLLVCLLGALFFSSGFVASSLPVGLHYYRFVAYQFIILVILAAAIPLVLLRQTERFSLREAFLCGLAVSMLCLNLALPHKEREKIISHKGLNYLQDERDVIEYFQAKRNKGRVYIEYLSDYSKYSFLSVHYISSRLKIETGFEAVVNSHLQESMSYRMLVASAKLLGAKTYNPPLLFPDTAVLDDQTKLEQLQAFGVTHVICAERKFCNNLREVVKGPYIKIGRYKIFELLPEGFKKIEPASKILLGYIDDKGTLPFYFVEYFMYAYQPLFKKYHLIDLTKYGSIPEGIDQLLLNTSKSVDAPLGFRVDPGIKVYRINYQPKNYVLNHYEVHYPHNVEFDRYQEAQEFLKNFSVQSGLAYVAFNPIDTLESPQFEFSSNGQEFTASGLTPGQFYRINYSYFPYWNVSGGEIFRGSEERIFIKAKESTVKGVFTPWRSSPSYVGLAMTLAALLFCLAIYRKA